MSVKSGSNQRSIKNLWINPQYQLKYMFWMTSTGLVLVVLNSLVFYAFIRENYALLVDLSPMTDDAKAQLYKELYQIIGLLGGIDLIFLVLVAVLGMIYSHRTAGPFFKFKKIFKEIGDGNMAARVHLRPTDDFQDVAQDFNAMMDKLQQTSVGKK